MRIRKIAVGEKINTKIKKKKAKSVFGVPRATFDPKRERLIGP